MIAVVLVQRLSEQSLVIGLGGYICTRNYNGTNILVMLGSLK